jgi:formylglycine-generating enzyme required for sulfatase activity/serine/threonine protein kinase
MNDKTPKLITPVTPSSQPTETYNAPRSTTEGGEDYPRTGSGSAPASFMRVELNDSSPARIGDYNILRILGEGGMGTVYLAEDVRLGRQVAIKTMKPELATPDDRARFLREARAAAAIEHDNIVTILHIGESADGSPFIAMPFLQGEMLEGRLKREPMTPLGILLKVALEVAEGLAAAHKKGLIHRDIKPANVWLEGDPTAPKIAQQIRRCKILDFGLARSMSATEMQLTMSGMLLGTPAYMAPEQARGERVDHRTDLFSLGVMLYRMTTGRLPFSGPTVMAVLTALATVNPPPSRTLNPNVPLTLSDLIKRLMKKDSGERVQSAAEVTAAIRQIAREQQAKKSAPPPLGLPTTAYVPPPIPVVPGKVAATLIEDRPADIPHHVPPRRGIGGMASLLEALPADDEEQAITSRRTMTRRAALALAVATPLGIGVCAGGLWWMKSGKEDPKDKPVSSAKPLKGPLVYPEPIVNSIGMKLAYIPAGEFMMGSPEGEGDPSERPRHKVKITKAFYLGIHEVTQRHFKAVMGYNPSYFSRDGKGKKDANYWEFNKPAGGKDKIGATDDPDAYPVENVSWVEVNEYCEKLSALAKEQEKNHLYRLPTEAEWEYACREGLSSYKKYHFGNELTSDDANISSNKQGRTSVVGSYKKPNKFGLHDLHGNVWEWCSDGQRLYSKDDQVNPTGPAAGSDRVIRGGSWGGTAEGCTAGCRVQRGPANRHDYLGFRLLLSSAIE